jgi:hypothetical protein
MFNQVAGEARGAWRSYRVSTKQLQSPVPPGLTGAADFFIRSIAAISGLGLLSTTWCEIAGNFDARSGNDHGTSTIPARCNDTRSWS